MKCVGLLSKWDRFVEVGSSKFQRRVQKYTRCGLWIEPSKRRIY